jgi:DNA-binding IclR family transcriptional regulator
MPQPKTTPRSSSADSNVAQIRDPYAVPALDKAVEVLDLLASSSEGLTMAEIVPRLDRSMGELYRVIVALERHNLIRRDEERDRYMLSLRLFEMGHRHPPTERLIEQAQPILDQLAQAIEQSCHLAVLHQGNVLVVASAQNPLPMQYSVRVGSRFPVLEASSGIVLLAHAPPVVAEPILADLPSNTRDAVLRRCESVRLTGCERVASSVVSGIVNLSAPIFDHRNKAIAAMTVPYLGQRYAHASVEEAEEKLIASARRLSVGLGAKDALTGS